MEKYRIGFSFFFLLTMMSGGALACLDYYLGIVSYSVSRDGLIGAFLCVGTLCLIESRSFLGRILPSDLEISEEELSASRIVGLALVLVHLIMIATGS